MLTRWSADLKVGCFPHCFPRRMYNSSDVRRSPEDLSTVKIRAWSDLNSILKWDLSCRHWTLQMPRCPCNHCLAAGQMNKQINRSMIRRMPDLWPRYCQAGFRFGHPYVIIIMPAVLAGNSIFVSNSTNKMSAFLPLEDMSRYCNP